MHFRAATTDWLLLALPCRCRTKHNDAKAVCAQGERCEFAHCTEEASVDYRQTVLATVLIS